MSEVTRSISTPPGWDASLLQGYPSIEFAGTHLYTWVERSTVRVKCLPQEHNRSELLRDILKKNPDISVSLT